MRELSPPVYDLFDGVLVRTVDRSNLVMLIGEEIPSGNWITVHTGSILVCYGLPYLHQPDNTLIPQWAYDDFQREYHGDEALRFILQRGDAFPRADVLGWQASTGKQDRRFFKEMDIAAKLRAVAYRTLDPATVIGTVSSIVWMDTNVDGLLPLADTDDRLNEWMLQSVGCFVANVHSLEKLPAA